VSLRDSRSRKAVSNNVHDHWVDGFGNDVITDFNRKLGDKIEISAPYGRSKVDRAPRRQRRRQGGLQRHHRYPA
jgi:hypothetical protein